MQKNVKIVLVIFLVIISVLLVDTLQAKIWDNRPIFKVTESKGDYQRDNGILVYTYIFTDNTKKTVFKWEKYAPPVNIKNQVFDEYSYMENGKIFIKSDTSKNEYFQIEGDFTNCKIKYIKMWYPFGYIFYIKEDGSGEILRTTTSGKEWNKVELDFELNDNCDFRFLNEFNPKNGFLLVPSEDGSKSDLYIVDELTSPEYYFVKVDISNINNTGRNLDYYNFPKIFEDNNSYIELEVGENKDDENCEKFVEFDYGYNWITEEDYYQRKQEENENEENFIAKYNKMVDEIDESIFLKDFENYNVDSDEIKITENEAIEIAKKGFEEYEERHKPSPIIEADLTVEIKDVMLNDFFVRKYGEASKIKEIKMRKAYVVTKYDGLDGLSIYVDVTTGLIIGLWAFGI